MRLCHDLDPFVQAALKQAGAAGRKLLQSDVSSADLLAVLSTIEVKNGWIDAQANPDFVPGNNVMSTADSAEATILTGLGPKIKSIFYATYSRTMLIRMKNTDDIEPTIETLQGLLKPEAGCLQYVEKDKVAMFANQFGAANMPNAAVASAAEWAVSAQTATEATSQNAGPAASPIVAEGQQTAESVANATADITLNDKLASLQWGLMYVDALKAWRHTDGEKAVVVAVLDTGVDYYHPELRDHIWTNEAELNGVPGVDDDNNGYIDDVVGFNFNDGNNDPMDNNGHGTHCAGVIAATANNEQGISGIAPSVTIMPIKVMDKNGSGRYSAFIQAIQFAHIHNVDATSNSYGGPTEDMALLHAIQELKSLYVVAAGNEGKSIEETKSYPASFNTDNMITVAASDQNDCMAPFSNYGAQTVHLAAPGVRIYSTVPTEFLLQKKNLTYNSYAPMDGTSMATPHVAAAGALVISALKAQGKAYRDQAAFVKQCLLDSVDKVSNFEGYTVTGGRLNVAKAVQCAFDRSP